ncbi:nucleotide exchange factor GrpE [bacterium]|nr:nucleotide exchange factor GrpE [bacterium]|tara:strand:- start:1012 stop:1611 length:600 start_codon:yes stop_codon:yes gene_type:complete
MGDKKDEKDVDFDVEHGENNHTEDIELEDIEDRATDKIKQLRKKLETALEEKQKLQDELQRAKADFLNARRRLEEERVRDRVRNKKHFVEDLLPLCDSFQMAMNNTEAWEKADVSWRKGVEGINAQLQNILKEYGVSAINPAGEAFDPNRHEAVGTETVTDKKLDDTVVSVMQSGYEITLDGNTEIIRPARVTTGQYEN